MSKFTITTTWANGFIASNLGVVNTDNAGVPFGIAAQTIAGVSATGTQGVAGTLTSSGNRSTQTQN